MFKAWTGSADEAEELARQLESHLNEYAAEVVSVSYAVTNRHHVLAVYREVDVLAEGREAAAVTVAEHIIEESQV